MQNQAKEHELASRCMKPILLVELTGASPQENPPSNASAATLLLFEFIASKECKAATPGIGPPARKAELLIGIEISSCCEAFRHYCLGNW
jgi:hypothetical protein